MSPLSAIAKAEEVAELGLDLATASHTAVQVHIIDGGWTTYWMTLPASSKR